MKTITLFLFIVINNLIWNTTCCSAFQQKAPLHHRLLYGPRRTWGNAINQNGPTVARVSVDTDIKINDSINAASATTSSAALVDNTHTIRPLHQNWWPVTLVNALEIDRPNAIMILGMRLVLFHDGESWTCLDDQCPHRFAPLSEGRIVDASPIANGGDVPVVATTTTAPLKNVQCAYHGWEFDGCGACQFIPQAQSSSTLNNINVIHYPVRLDCGMVWVWTDPATATSLAPTLSLPISPLLRKYYASYGDDAGFMRDMPYGVELLGENFLDASHLPYSHHGNGRLRRDLGGPLPYRMLSEPDKRQVAKLEIEAATGTSVATLPDDVILPRFQVELPNASVYEPILKSVEAGPNATFQLGFYEPSHIRWIRSGLKVFGSFNVELFISPIDSARCKVILFNAMRVSSDSSNTETTSDRFNLVSSSKAVLNKLRQKLTKKLFHPASVRMHMFSHLILDGDGIFLHKQGERMRRYGKTFRDYKQPYSADVLLNAYRRYLATAASMSLESGNVLAAASVSDVNYHDNQSRDFLLDRYSSHTKHCSVCQQGLDRCKKRQELWNVARTAFLGAAGASSSALLGAVALTTFIVPPAAALTVPTVLWQILGATTLCTTAGSIVANRQKNKAQKEAEKFFFVDYVHAEKD